MSVALPRPAASPRPAPPASALAVGRRVLGVEAAALAALAASLDDRFATLVERLAGLAGRVVVTGMGKSGHVARKIAATLASTGSPALFLHPAEASHGDLGMITAADAVLALSNSGETPELVDIIAHCKRFAIPLFAITGQPGSSLAESADLALLLPACAEACPLGLAPTTSTTMTLALGDALAIALLERRGFDAQAFGVLHPGGKLGRKLVKVAELMHVGEELPLVGLATPMGEALLTMTAKSFGCVGVLDGHGRLSGVITDGDLRRHMGADLLQLQAAAVMTAAPKTIRPQALAGEALAVMNDTRRPCTVLFVVEDGRPIGIVHMHDCLRARVA